MNAHATIPDDALARARFDTERELIGSLLIYACAVSNNLAAAIVGPEHFSDPMMARLFAFIQQGGADGLQGFPLSSWVIGQIRPDVQHLAEIGFTPSELIANCIAHAGPAIAIEGAARQIKHDHLNTLLQVAVSEGDTAEAEKLAAGMERLSRAHLDQGKETETIGALSLRHVEDLSAAFQRGEAPRDYAACGLSDLARKIGGWRRKRLYIVAGRPGMGKSTFALSSLLRTAMKGHGVVMFALEMGRQELTEMAMCDLAWSSHSRVEYRDISTDAVMQPGFAEKFETVHRVQPLLNSIPLLISDRGGLTMADVRSQAMQFAQRLATDGKRLDVICIDHLGLIKATGNYRGNKVAETEEVSGDLKRLAKEMDCAVVALCQLSRNVEGRDDKRPTLADLRWSGAIEQDADVILFPFRPEYYLSRKEDDTDKEIRRQAKLAGARNRIELLIEKHRGGPTGTVDLFCDIGCAVIRDMEQRR